MSCQYDYQSPGWTMPVTETESEKWEAEWYRADRVKRQPYKLDFSNFGEKPQREPLEHSVRAGIINREGEPSNRVGCDGEPEQQQPIQAAPPEIGDWLYIGMLPQTERKLLTKHLERLQLGLKHYGKLDLDDGRDHVKEALEEAYDMANYLAMSLSRLGENSHDK